MNKKATLIALTCVGMCISLVAHEFWLQPSRTKVKVGERVSLYTMVGEDFTGELWKGKGNRVTSYKHYYREEIQDLLLAIEPGEAVVDLPFFIPTKEGTHILTFSTNKAFLETEADAFEKYLKEDGLMDAYEIRNANDEKFMKGRERYSRCAKLLIQAGLETDQTFKKKTGLELEIIPQSNPYESADDKGITYKVFYYGNPLPDALVKWWHKEGTSIEKDEAFTDHRGEVTFHSLEPGLYMISAVHMIRLNNDPDAEWQSTWSTLVFGNDF